MDIGRLRHRVTLKKQVNTQNDYGAATQEWIDIATVWAGVEPISGKEYFSSQHLNSEVSIKIVIRYLEGVLPTSQVVFKNRKFEVVSVLNYREHNRMLQLMCKELFDE
ncbi:Bacteriophage head-tail adaptor [Phocoenobacter uteri]|uniref:Bacteriophage head-tail adaptor n=1 Tax=Phocoenobacter uteri TaxID=146806 RepID=A0A379CB91_9PAST|nr:phage head closure protein [Phocoenobacter uteri]MDG6880951.1 head-tail adaptor protein [Phocoenobacter uteri]MDG6882796.1 head-tail adaptor protein [Phocoenobacter uteri]SUB58966.1 Bacteriophage head-tail adaptor [Phocoenobacter uteri]